MKRLIVCYILRCLHKDVFTPTMGAPVPCDAPVTRTLPLPWSSPPIQVNLRYASCRTQDQYLHRGGAVFSAAPSAPCTPLLLLLWLCSTCCLGRFQSEIAAAVKIQSLARMGIAWNRADERRFEMKKCVPNSTLAIPTWLVPLYVTVRCVNITSVFVYYYSFHFGGVIPNQRYWSLSCGHGIGFGDALKGQQQIITMTTTTVYHYPCPVCLVYCTTVPAIPLDQLYSMSLPMPYMLVI